MHHQIYQLVAYRGVNAASLFNSTQNLFLPPPPLPSSSSKYKRFDLYVFTTILLYLGFLVQYFLFNQHIIVIHLHIVTIDIHVLCMKHITFWSTLYYTIYWSIYVLIDIHFIIILLFIRCTLVIIRCNVTNINQYICTLKIHTGRQGLDNSFRQSPCKKDVCFNIIMQG